MYMFIGKNKRIILLSVVILIVAIVFVAAIASKDIRNYLRTYVSIPTPTPSPTPLTEEEIPLPPNFGETLERLQADCSAFVKSGFQRNLYYGFSGTDVLCWQMTLNLLNIYGDILTDATYQTGSGSLGYETTYFGTRTYSATIGFQYLTGLPETGRLDAATRYMIKKDFFDPLVSGSVISMAPKAKISLVAIAFAQIPGDIIIKGGEKIVDGAVNKWREGRNENDCWDKDGADPLTEGWTFSRFVFDSNDPRQQEQFSQREDVSKVFPPFVESKYYKDGATGESTEAKPDIGKGLMPPILNVDKCADSTHVKEWVCASKKITRFKDVDVNNNPVPKTKGNYIDPQTQKQYNTDSDKGLRGVAASQVMPCPSGKVCKEKKVNISFKVGTPGLPPFGLGGKEKVINRTEDVGACVPTPTPTPAMCSCPCPTPTPTPTPAPGKCTDTDNGLYIYTPGTTMVNSAGVVTKKNDECSTDLSSITEQYCENNVSKSSGLIRCPNGCRTNGSGQGYCFNPSSSPTPTPTPTPTTCWCPCSSPTPTPTPTPTPRPSSTPTPTSTSSPTPHPTYSPSPTPTSSPGALRDNHIDGLLAKIESQLALIRNLINEISNKIKELIGG